MGKREADEEEIPMTVHAIPVRQVCLYFVLASADNVLAQIGVSRSPIDRAYRGARAVIRPCVLGYAAMGSTLRAASGLKWLRDELNSRWVARDGWWSVPEEQGSTFRRCFYSAVHRYGLQEAKKCIHHVDLLEYSAGRAAAPPRFGKGMARAHTSRALVDAT
jgi:hypothetical protein